MAVPLLGAFLAGAAAPLVKKVLVALGIGIVSYGGLSVLYGQAQSLVVSHWGQLGGAALQIGSLAGFPQACGIILSALSARIALVAVQRFALVAT